MSTEPRVDRAQSSGVEVKGLEGTLQAYDVRDTMNRRLDALGACQQQRIRKVRALEGSIELAIHVNLDGSVGQADVILSSLGDQPTEQCIAQVVRETRFPKPHGGEADVKWNMSLEPFGRGAPEPFDEERLEEPLELNLPDLAEQCGMTRQSPKLSMTAYVAPSGKVVAAGGSSDALGQDELLACASEHVKTWRLPRGKRLTKAQFVARYRPALNDKQRAAIRKKHERKRRAEAKRKQAEAKRERAKARRERQRRSAQGRRKPAG